VYEILGRNSGHVRPKIEKGWVAGCWSFQTGVDEKLRMVRAWHVSFYMVIGNMGCYYNYEYLYMPKRYWLIGVIHSGLIWFDVMLPGTIKCLRSQVATGDFGWPLDHWTIGPLDIDVTCCDTKWRSSMTYMRQMEVILGSITITTTIHHAILIFPGQKTVDTCASLMEQYSNHSWNWYDIVPTFPLFLWFESFSFRGTLPPSIGAVKFRDAVEHSWATN
jgi:hypothetical protein